MSAAPQPHNQLESIKLNCIMLKVNEDLPGIQTLIRSGIPRLPPDHLIRTISYLPEKDKGGLLCLGSCKQTYLTQWREVIAPLFGETYTEQLKGDTQRLYKCQSIKMRRDCLTLYNSAVPLEHLLPTVSIQIKRPEGPGKRTKVVLPNGQAGVQIMQQTVLERVQAPEEGPRRRVKAQAKLRDGNPFEMPDFTPLLKAFLADPKPWEDPAPPPQRRDEELTVSFAKRLRESNKPPKHWDCFKAFFPPCARKPKEYLTILSELFLPEEQAKAIKDLAAFYNARGWAGFCSLLPSTDMQETTYGLQCSFPADKSTCVFEGVRRALRLEAELASLAQYMMLVVNGAQSLVPIPPNAQHSVRLLLEFSCGVGGKGEEMWAPLPQKEAEGLARLAEGASPHVLEVRGWLEALRALRPEAFKPRYVMGTQVGWMLSSLALAFANRGGDPRAEGAVGAMLGALKKEWGARETVYRECLKPLFKYGGLLTRWAPFPVLCVGVPLTRGDAGWWGTTLTCAAPSERRTRGRRFPTSRLPSSPTREPSSTT